MPTATELRELEDEELETRLMEYRREMLNLRFQLATGQLDNYSRLNAAKRDVARVLTILRDREIALAEGREVGPVFLERPVRPARRRPEPAEDTVEDFDDEVLDDEIMEADPAEVIDVDPVVDVDAGDVDADDDAGTDEEDE
jgi:large subunit ribosomal protein L29